jgi:hypothetical protein
MPWAMKDAPLVQTHSHNEEMRPERLRDFGGMHISPHKSQYVAKKRGTRPAQRELGLNPSTRANEEMPLLYSICNQNDFFHEDASTHDANPCK